MNEKDTIIKLQNEVNEGLKKELNTVYYCANELMKECKRLKKLSKGRFIMGIGTGMIIAGLYQLGVNAYIASKEKKEKNLTDSDEYLKF